MKLQPEYYNFIISGTKRIEIRLNDEKRRLIQIGDIILFKKLPELKDSFQAKVTDLLKYNKFEELFKEFDIEILADKSMTKEKLIKVLNQFYTEEEQLKYGVIGIKLELL